jgi:hypothetical protein
MNIFKPGSMLQEHRQQQASQRGKQRTAGQTQPNFEFSLEVDAPNINEII